MSVSLDPKEILLYLRELGYKDINAEQLRDFMKDLKKLIKYEERQKAKEKEQENKENVNVYNNINKVNVRGNGDVYENLFNTATHASKAKTNPKKESVISVQISRPVRTRRSESECTDNLQSNLLKSVENSQFLTESVRSSEFDKTKDTHTTKSKAKSSVTVKSKDRFTEPELRPKSSFIRPRIPVKTCKSDPVALYQKYQKEWKKANIPGENNRAALRWAIRERLMA